MSSRQETTVARILGGRRAGMLLHPTSLPGTGPCGSIGREARHFLGFLRDCGIGVWQVLPLGPVHGLFASPYQCLSAHAGNPDLICLDTLVEWGWLARDQLQPHRGQSLLAAQLGFLGRADVSVRAEFDAFCTEQAYWLEDFALFTVLRAAQGERAWSDWPRPLREREPAALEAARAHHGQGLEQIRFEQFAFFRQWRALRESAAESGIRLFGDMPIFVAYDSADVWAEPAQFQLRADGQPAVVAGVPPDYFSATGQRWGNPHYDWTVMQADGFRWWRRRLQTALRLFDLVRIDHFRGLRACWEIAPEEATATNGRWREVPGAELLSAIEREFGRLPLVAEDLGLITPDVLALRDRFGLPGMKVLQFAFGGTADNPYLPHHHRANAVVYLGTHDNDTALGWFEALGEEEQRRVLEYFAHPAEAMPWPLLRATLASVADLAVLTLQDVLALGGEHRMNRPGTTEGNWHWRFQWPQIAPDLARRLRRLLETYDRLA